MVRLLRIIVSGDWWRFSDDFACTKWVDLMRAEEF